MSVKVRLDLDPFEKILSRRDLEEDGEAQLFFTHEVARHCDPYVPMDTGMLKNTKQIDPNKITYPQPYAQKQYFENKGKGLRGKEWDKRMMADRGEEIVTGVANFIGGKAEK
ncbi:minor capsid protein [Hominibacterium faecale]|uniref:minor capsid protein n=1 Tax=Hominibacterium faecale TaxID=2839743 RepID=UPI0022B29396|nr:minor capsid protein [Hominibacterium faecale]